MSTFIIEKSEEESRTYRTTIDTSLRTTPNLVIGKQMNPHSVWKFFQAYATVRGDTEGNLSNQDIAIMCSSNSGQEFHADIVRRMLGRIDLDESALSCGERNFFRSKRGEDIPDQCYCDCGGKHAGFLTLAKQLATTPDQFDEYASNYLEPNGIVQQSIIQALLEDGLVTADEVESWEWETDGCGAPIPVMNETTVARLFLLLGDDTNPYLQRMYDSAAMYPELIGGTDGRLVTEISKKGIRESGDVIVKDGFGSVLALSIRDGQRSIGVIIHDIVQDNFRDDELFVVLLRTLEELNLPIDRIKDIATELYDGELHTITIRKEAEVQKELQRPRRKML